jgi:cytidylate kinase
MPATKAARPNIRLVNGRVRVLLTPPKPKRKKTWTKRTVTVANERVMKRDIAALKQAVRKLRKRLQKAGI